LNERGRVEQQQTRKRSVQGTPRTVRYDDASM
jgi:hypothetical protein